MGTITRWIRLIRNGNTSFTVELYDNANYTGTPTTATANANLSSITGLKYITVRMFSQSNSGTINMEIDDMKFYNNQTSPTTLTKEFTFTQGDAQLVSSLTDKSGLKAHYSLDSTQSKTADLSSADWSENFSSSSPTSYYEHYTSGYDGNMVPYKDSSNGLWIDLDDFTGKVVGTLDLQNAGLMSANANDNYWTLRFKVNFSSITNGTGSIWIGLSSNTDASRDTQKFVGVRFKSNSAGMTTGASRYTGGSALSGSSGENDTGTTASTYSANTDYYVTVMRTGTGSDSTRTATVKAEIRTGSHTGTLLGTSYDDIYAQTGLRYFKVMNNRLSSGSAGQHRGRIYDVEFYDNEADVDGCKNDFSSTSDLDGMTNLPTNTLFLQTDTDISYWWKQSDNTWRRDGSPPVGGNLHAWYDASDLPTVTKDSSNLVSQLNDKSGNGYNLTASGTGSGGQPLWVSGGKNSLDIIDFASSKIMKAQWSATSQPMTFVAFVYTPPSDGSQDNIWDNYDNTNGSMGFANDSSTNNIVAYAPTNLIAGSSSNYTQKWGLFTIIYDTTSSSISINGNQKVSGNIGSNSSYGLTLSSHRTSATYGQIKLAELLIYNKVLSSDELTKINDYFVNKWGAVLE